MAKILMIYSTTDGHTLEICERLQEVIGQQDVWVQNVSFNAYLIYFLAVNVAELQIIHPHPDGADNKAEQ